MDRKIFKTTLQALAAQNIESFPDGRKLVNKIINLITKIKSQLGKEEKGTEQIIDLLTDGFFEAVTLFFKEVKLDKDKARKNILSRFILLNESILGIKVIGDNASQPINKNVLQRKDFDLDGFINSHTQKLLLKMTSFLNDATVLNNLLTNDPSLRDQFKIFAEKKFTDFKFEKMNKQDGFAQNIQLVTKYLILLKQMAQLTLDVDYVADQDAERRANIGSAGPSSAKQDEDYIKKIHNKYTSLKLSELYRLVDADKKLNTNWRGTKLVKEGAKEDRAAKQEERDRLAKQADDFLKAAEAKPTAVKAAAEPEASKEDEPVYVNKYSEKKNANKEITEALYTFLTLKEIAYVFWFLAHGFNNLLSYTSIVRKKIFDNLERSSEDVQSYATQIRELNLAFDSFRNTIGSTISKTEINFTNSMNEQFKRINSFIENESDQHSDILVNSLKLIQNKGFFEIGSESLIFLNGMIDSSGEQFINRAVGGFNIVATKDRTHVKTFEDPSLYLFNKIRQDILTRIIIAAVPRVSDTEGGIDSSVVLDEIAKDFVYNITMYLNKDKKFKLKFERYVVNFYEKIQKDFEDTKEQWGGILSNVDKLGAWANSVQINDLETDITPAKNLYNLVIYEFIGFLPKIKTITEVTLKVFGTGFVEKVLKEKDSDKKDRNPGDVYFNSTVEHKFTGDLQKLFQTFMKCKKIHRLIYSINKEYNKSNISIVRKVELTKSFVAAITELNNDISNNFFGALDNSLKQTIRDSMEGFGQSLENSKSGLFLLEDSIKTFVEQVKDTFDAVPTFEDEKSDSKLSNYYKQLFFKRIPFIQAVHSIEQGEDIRAEFLTLIRRVIVLIILEAYYPGVNFSKIGSMNEFNNSTVVMTLKGICEIYNLDYDAIMKQGMVSSDNFGSTSGLKKVISEYLDYFVSMALSKDPENKSRSVEDDKSAYNAVVEIVNNLLNISEEDKIIATRNAEKIFVIKVGSTEKVKEFIQTTKGNIKTRDFLKQILESVLKVYKDVAKSELSKYKKRISQNEKKLDPTKQKNDKAKKGEVKTDG